MLRGPGADVSSPRAEGGTRRDAFRMTGPPPSPPPPSRKGPTPCPPCPPVCVCPPPPSLDAPHRVLRPGGGQGTGDTYRCSGEGGRQWQPAKERKECHRVGRTRMSLSPPHPPQCVCVPYFGEVGCRVGIWGLSGTPSGILGGPQGERGGDGTPPWIWEEGGFGGVGDGETEARWGGWMEGQTDATRRKNGQPEG